MTEQCISTNNIKPTYIQSDKRMNINNKMFCFVIDALITQW
jgi:hypothetical protein